MLPDTYPLGRWTSTASQLATLKYFWVVSLLILVQILAGIVTAHYGVEGDGFYGIKLYPSTWREMHVYDQQLYPIYEEVQRGGSRVSVSLGDGWMAESSA